MTPEIIQTLASIRREFYSLFAIALNIPTTITKGNSYSSHPSRISWLDSYQRSNYACVYAHKAPDDLLLDRPFIIRLGINKGLDIKVADSGKEVQKSNRSLLRIELTLLPSELISFVPWVVICLQAHEKDMDRITVPPYPLNFNTLDDLLLHGAWTQAAAIACDKPWI